MTSYRRCVAVAVAVIGTTALSGPGWSHAVARESAAVPIGALPFAGTVAGPTAESPGGTGTTVANDVVAVQCNGGTPLRDPQWFALPAGDGASVYARTSGLQYARIALPVPVSVALVDRGTGLVLRCASGLGNAQPAPLTASSTQPMDVVAYFPQPYQDVSDGLPDTLRLLVDRTSGSAPANDSADAAEPIPALPVHETVDTSLSDDDSVGFQGCHWVSRHTAYWTYTAPETGRVHLAARADLPTAPGDSWPGASLAVARRTDDGAVQVVPGSDTEDCVTPVSTSQLEVQAGTTYLVGAFVAEDPSWPSLVRGGRITLDVERVGAEANGASG